MAKNDTRKREGPHLINEGMYKIYLNFTPLIEFVFLSFNCFETFYSIKFHKKS